MGGAIVKAAVPVRYWGALAPAEIAMELAIKGTVPATKKRWKKQIVNATLVSLDGISIMLNHPSKD